MHANEYVTDIYVKDVIPAEFHVEVVSYDRGEVELTPLGVGEMHATMLEWWIDELQPNETALLVFETTTRLNPAGKQEFTSPGIYILNTGYEIHWTYDGEDYEAVSGKYVVEAIDCE
jgi:hypothetical protein